MIRLLLQRVQFASVLSNSSARLAESKTESETESEVELPACAKIGAGLLVYVGMDVDATHQQVDKASRRLLNYRVFPKAETPWALDVTEAQLELLLVSQFTLCAQTNRGRKPSFSHALPSRQARELFHALLAQTKALYQPDRVQSGVFQSSMQVSSCNDGPINLILEID